MDRPRKWFQAHCNIEVANFDVRLHYLKINDKGVPLVDLFEVISRPVNWGPL